MVLETLFWGLEIAQFDTVLYSWFIISRVDFNFTTKIYDHSKLWSDAIFFNVWSRTDYPLQIQLLLNTQLSRMTKFFQNLQIFSQQTVNGPDSETSELSIPLGRLKPISPQYTHTGIPMPKNQATNSSCICERASKGLRWSSKRKPGAARPRNNNTVTRRRVIRSSRQVAQGR